MSDTRFCPVSFPHPAHDSCDGSPFDAMAEIAKLESKVDALMREKEQLEQGLKNVIRVSDEFVEDTGLKHGDPLTDAVDAVRALVREQNTTQEDQPNMEDSSVARSTNHPSAT